jgi:heme oxygenase
MASSAEPFPQSKPLAESIAAATRKAHATLNKLIIARLPESMPPRAADPSPYVSGLLHVAPVYIQFEALWQNMLDSSPALTPSDSIPDGCDSFLPVLDNGSILTPQNEKIQVHRPSVCSRLHSLLEHLQLPGLTRSSQLRADLRRLTRWPHHDLEVELKTVREMGALADFLDHMKLSVESKPHVLVAYAYIFYMALFAGGRFIRASLEYAGPEFWSRTPSPVKPTMRMCEPADDNTHEHDDNISESGMRHQSHYAAEFPLRFFHFSTPMDGEDLKKDFKERLAESEAILTAREKADIVRESVAIFDHMTLIVGQLHVVCAGSIEAAAKESSSFLGLSGNLLMARLRDSVAVAKDRRSAKKLPYGDTTASEGGYNIACPVLEHLHAKSSSEGDSRGIIRNPTMPIQHASMLKSVRFEGTLAQPDRKHQVPRFNGSAELEVLKKRDLLNGRGALLFLWTLACVFGAFILGSHVVLRQWTIAL